MAAMVVPIDNSEVPHMTTVTPTAKLSRAGRPSLITINPISRLMPFLTSVCACSGDTAGSPEWFDDIVTGSIATAAGTSKTSGRFNVSPAKVKAAMHCSTISVAALQVPTMSTRAAQLLAKATRHAVHGVSSYLDRHPEIRARLIAEVNAEDATW